jgi:hypothetical protein
LNSSCQDIVRPLPISCTSNFRAVAKHLQDFPRLMIRPIAIHTNIWKNPSHHKADRIKSLVSHRENQFCDLWRRSASPVIGWGVNLDTQSRILHICPGCRSGSQRFCFFLFLRPAAIFLVGTQWPVSTCMHVSQSRQRHRLAFYSKVSSFTQLSFDTTLNPLSVIHSLFIGPRHYFRHDSTRWQRYLPSFTLTCSERFHLDFIRPTLPVIDASLQLSPNPSRKVGISMAFARVAGSLPPSKLQQGPSHDYITQYFRVNMFKFCSGGALQYLDPLCQ